jgi:hypothetical protein
MQFIKVGECYINLAQVCDVVDGDESLVLKLAVTEDGEDGYAAARTITLTDEDAEAVRSWLDIISTDVVEQLRQDGERGPSLDAPTTRYVRTNGHTVIDEDEMTVGEAASRNKQLLNDHGAIEDQHFINGGARTSHTDTYYWLPKEWMPEAEE